MKTVGNFLGQSNGFPIDTGTFASIQENIEMVGVIGNIVGNKAILYGCELSSDGLTRSPGYVFLRTEDYPEGEILFFEGGDVTTYCKVSKESINIESEGVSYNASYTIRKLIPYTANRSSYKWSDFFRASDMFNLLNQLTPIGSIQMYAGQTEPSDKWMFCSGQRLEQKEYPELYALLGTSFGSAEEGYFMLPNLKGRFVVGYDTDSEDYNSIGKMGGEAKHTLKIDEMPSHSHEMYLAGLTQKVQSGTTGPGIEIRTSGVSTGASGGGQPHENRPPYIVLSYIIRVK